MKIIAFTGRAGSGKDTAAQALIDRGWVRIGFADKLKEMALAINPLIMNIGGFHVTLRMLVGDLGWDGAKRCYPEVRRLLQAIGTDAVRDIIGPGVWASKLIHEVTKLQKSESQPVGVVVPDLRFPNEADAIEFLGGKIFKIRRDACEKLRHSSEDFVDEMKADCTYHNNGSIQQMHEWVVKTSEEVQHDPLAKDRFAKRLWETFCDKIDWDCTTPCGGSLP